MAFQVISWCVGSYSGILHKNYKGNEGCAGGGSNKISGLEREGVMVIQL